MTAEEWAERIAHHANTPPAYKEGIARIVEVIQREALEQALASIQPMPGSELSMKQIDEMSEFIDKIDKAFRDRTEIDVTAWERLPEMFRNMRDYALFLQGPLSDIVNDNSAHFDNWVKVRKEAYNQAISDAVQYIDRFSKSNVRRIITQDTVEYLSLELTKLKKEPSDE